MSTSLGTHRPDQDSGRSGHLAWGGGLVFLLAYLANSPLSNAFADRDLPRPGAATADVMAYFGNEQLAVALSAATHLISVLGLVAFAVGIGRLLPADRFRNAAATLAVGSLVVSAGTSLILAVIADGASVGTVMFLRDTGFYTGGVVHVVSLGLLVASMVFGTDAARFGRANRIFGRIVAVIAILSILSLAFYYASILLPAGRVLSMVWTVTAGVGLIRRAD